MSRLEKRFAQLRAADRAAFVPFLTAGDPDAETAFAILEKLPEAGADVIELGMPFSDPMADGPAIQASSTRALQAGMNVKGTLAMVARFRERDNTTPIVLMGYFNPIHAYGVERFVQDAARAGVDGFIVVDLGPSEDEVLRTPANKADIDIIRLATPTTDAARLPAVLDGAGGYLYYVSVAGVTGTKNVPEEEVRVAVERIRKSTNLPCAVGFGIRTPEQAAAIARIADAAVVGSAIVSGIGAGATAGTPRAQLVEETLSFCESLANAVHKARIKVGV
ncbi:MAG: tryptophan synthase alpha chain [Pseudomonadota bacterium]|jgi:tryptophan synthase alpha chain